MQKHARHDYRTGSKANVTFYLFTLFKKNEIQLLRYPKLNSLNGGGFFKPSFSVIL